MSLSASRQRVLLDGQTAMARKVFEVVPIAESYTAQQIHSALVRNTRANVDFRVIEGCLSMLHGAGLVSKSSNLYQRAPVKSKSDTTMKQTETDEEQDAPTQQTAVEILTELAERARKLAADLDAAAALIIEENQNRDANVRKLEQLQSILKSLA